MNRHYALIQWVTVMLIALCAWLLGHFNIHINHFALFIGALLVMGVTLIGVVVSTARLAGDVADDPGVDS